MKVKRPVYQSRGLRILQLASVKQLANAQEAEESAKEGLPVRRKLRFPDRLCLKTQIFNDRSGIGMTSTKDWPLRLCKARDIR